MKTACASAIALLLATGPALAQTISQDGNAPAPAVSVAVTPPKPDRAQAARVMDYPAASLRAKEEGEVRVSMCVSAEGRVSDVKLLESSGRPRLDEATLSQLPRMRFEPAKDAGGNAVAVCDPPYEMNWVWKLPGL